MANAQYYHAKSIGQRIKALRRSEKHKVTQEELGDYVGCSRQRIITYEKGTTMPSDVLGSIADFFNIPADDLLGRPNKKFNDETSFLLKCSEYTGLSIEAIKELHMYQTDNDMVAPIIREQAKRVVHLLSWIIAHDRDVQNVSEDRESLLDEIYNYFRVVPSKSFRILNAKKIANGEDGLVGYFDEGELLIAQESAASYVNAKLIETAKQIAIQERMKALKQAYWKEVTQTFDIASSKEFNKTEEFEDIEVSLDDL